MRFVVDEGWKTNNGYRGGYFVFVRDTYQPDDSLERISRMRSYVIKLRRGWMVFNRWCCVNIPNFEPFTPWWHRTYLEGKENTGMIRVLPVFINWISTRNTFYGNLKIWTHQSEKLECYWYRPVIRIDRNFMGYSTGLFVYFSWKPHIFL